MSDYNGHDFSASDPVAAQFGSPAGGSYPESPYIPPQTRGVPRAPRVNPTGYSGGTSAVAAVPILGQVLPQSLGDKLAVLVAKGPPPWVNWVIAILAIVNGVRAFTSESHVRKKRKHSDRD